MIVAFPGLFSYPFFADFKTVEVATLNQFLRSVYNSMFNVNISGAFFIDFGRHSTWSTTTF